MGRFPVEAHNLDPIGSTPLSATYLPSDRKTGAGASNKALRLLSFMERMITPSENETLEHFTIRAHRELAKTVADPVERNNIVWSAWRDNCGPTDEEKMAQRSFDPDKYDANNNQCVFAEHSTVDGRGNPKTYDLRELAKITRDCNERIADVGAFAAIADRHTPNPGDVDKTEPRVLGYAGPYRLGMIGNKNPKWAIYADEWHLKDAKPLLEGKQRRSVELWSFKTTGRSHFDPIAALGAESPRLPLPTRFSASQEPDASVEKYAFAVPALPGGASTFTPKTKYANGEQNMALNDQDVALVMNALQQTPQFQFLTQLMQEMSGGNQPGSEQPQAPANPAQPEKNSGNANPTADLDDLLGNQPNPNPMEPEKKMQNAQYSANANGAEVTVEKYQQLHNAHTTLINDFGRLTARVQQIERDKADAVRVNQLRALARNYEGFVDETEENQLCLYSLGSNMSDDEFSKHIVQVEKYAQRAATPQRMVPAGELMTGGRSEVGVDKYEAECAAEAVKIHTAAVNGGDYSSTWESSLAKAREKVKR